MRIEVIAESGDVVEFRCSTGVGAGVWHSDDPPKVGWTYEVELDIDAEGTDLTLRSGGSAVTWLDGDRVVFGGKLRVMTANAVYLEIGGATVSIELPDDVCVAAKSDEAVEVTTARTSVHLFPYVV